VLGVGHGHGDSLRDGDAQAAGVIGVLGQQPAAKLGQLGWAGVHRGAPDLHHRLAVWLGPVGGRHLPHLALHAVLGGGEGQRRAPLAGAGFGGQLGDPFSVVIEGLWHRGVGLVRARRADALVLVEDLGRGVEQRLQAVGPEQRAGAPQLVDVEHAAGDVDVAIGGHLLLDERHREQRRQVVGTCGLVRARVQRRWRRRRQVGDDVVPLRGLLVFAEKDLGGHVVGHDQDGTRPVTPACGPPSSS
jgi:hypothetical protein